MNRGLVLLDRDGVLNATFFDTEHGTVQSPLHPDQVKILTGVPEALKLLTDAGFGLAIVTNQPGFAKGQTTHENLDLTHKKVLDLAQARGGRILSSHICFHRSEDGCFCRKPRTGLLEEAFKENPTYSIEQSWMVGDGITDLEAGLALSLRCAFIGPKKLDAINLFEQKGIKPDIWTESLLEIAQLICKNLQNNT